jgi:hypothetical protein
LKQLTTILLFSAVLGHTFSAWFMLLSYQWNKKYIATHLCTNRNRPELQCEGKCYLCKRLQKENSKDQQNPERRSENRFEAVSFQPAELMPLPSLRFKQATYFDTEDGLPNLFTIEFFHPPQL